MSNKKIGIRSAKKLIENEITPIDLFILKKLNEGAAESTLYKLINEEFGTKTSRSKVEKRIKELENQGILLKKRAVMVDPTKLYDHIFRVFIKTKLSSTIIADGFEPVTWRKAFDLIMQINEQYGYPIKRLVHVSAGKYDFIGDVYTNDREDYCEFKSELVRMTGIIVSMDSKFVEPGGGFYFDSPSIPDHKEYAKFLSQFHERLDDTRHYRKKRKR